MSTANPSPPAKSVGMALPGLVIAIAMIGDTLLYVVLQMFDGYVLTPLVDRRSVELPPVLTISAQVFLGLVFGFIGLLIASPFTAAVMLLIKMLYIEDVLGDPIMRESVANEHEAKAQRIEPPSDSKLEEAKKA